MDANTQQYKDITENPEVTKHINNVFAELMRLQESDNASKNRLRVIYKSCEDPWLTDAMIERDTDKLIAFARNMRDIMFCEDCP